MGYFPEDIPFMSEEELKYYEIRIPKDKQKDTSSNECVGVYISGLEMPQEGRITLQIDSNGGVYVVNKFSITSEKYEKSMIATEIQPHGRLIDKDKLRRELFVNFNGERIPFYDCDNFPTKIAYRDLYNILAEQKTIIKAEE